MAASDRAAAPVLAWRRLAEWAAMAALLLVLMLTFVHYTRSVREQAEVAAFKTTLGGLRTALVLAHLQQQASQRPQTNLPLDFNPFTRLSRLPANYAGVMPRARSRATAPGTWVYAPECPCVGYRPQDDASLSSLVDDPLIWFEVTGMPGVLQLTAREKYLWYNELLN